MATKIEAFEGRGQEDFIASHDMEDIIAVLDGRQEVASEIKNSNDNLQRFLGDKFQTFLSRQAFLDALPGHLPPDHASQARLPRLKNLIAVIAGAKEPS